MVATKTMRRYTPEEYLALERRAEWKHEYIDGCIVAMPGVSRNHDRIARAVLVLLDEQSRDGSCEAFTSDVRVGNAATGRYTYPDVSVVCGEQEFEDAE